MQDSANKTVSCHFSYDELQYALVMLTEGQDKINNTDSFKGFQDVAIQDSLIEKIRDKCWEFHKHN